MFFSSVNEKICCGPRLRQIRDANERANVVLGAQFRRKSHKPVAPPRRQHQIRSARRQLPRQIAVPIPALAPVISAHFPCQ